ncbi:hypothetical protein [Hymenobacter metallicola]|uniref:hypothetical protein n=1 Tax=Hymenobacter metallicola TaxID=2563114 RepID=UPI00143692C6|nr:hypothetical protein [Hymenobacter metallicola]
MKRPDLHQLLQQRLAQAQATWNLLYSEFKDLLPRIGTRIPLVNWEESADTPAS